MRRTPRSLLGSSRRTRLNKVHRSTCSSSEVLRLKPLSANNYAMLVQIVLGEGLKNGVFNEEDKKAYIEAWSQPGALTGGLNYYRASRVGPPAPGDSNAANFAAGMPSLDVKV